MTREQQQFWSEVCRACDTDILPAASLDPYINALKQRQNLSPTDAVAAMKILVSGSASESQQGAFLLAMQEKQVTVDELAAFACVLRRLAARIEWNDQWVKNPDAVLADTCGTGGGTVATYNISTTIMFILAAAGVHVAKHGNRAITSKCGSADVLQALGVTINLSPEGVRCCISEVGVGFLFAPMFHTAFKHVQNVRRQLRTPTFFNLLGPLVNPASYPEDTVPMCQVLGVNAPQSMQLMAEVLRRLNVRKACVVHGYNDAGDQGMDEVSTLGKTVVVELDRGSDGAAMTQYEITPEQFGLERTTADQLLGGDAQRNAEIVRAILRGDDMGPKRDIAVLNAAVGLYVCGKSGSIQEGVALAREQIDRGAAYRKLEQLIDVSTAVQ